MTRTLAMVPAAHAYTRLVAPSAQGWDVLADPHPDLPDRDAADGERWWPPKMLSAQWVEGHDFDVMHVHFGLEQVELDVLEAAMLALRRSGRPLVHTVHDLANPHLDDQDAHEERLALMMRHADGLLTLTRGAALEVERRWGRRPLVVPHPHLVPLRVAARLRSGRAVPGEGRPVVGVSCKDLRAGTDALGLLPGLRRVARALPVDVRVHVHDTVWRTPRDDRDRAVRAGLVEAADGGDLSVVVHPRMEDAELWRHLAGTDVVVLPYRHGTHSGWLEACHDLGTSVVAPAIGHLRDQRPAATYEWLPGGVDEDSLVDAVRQALRQRQELGLAGPTPAQRRAEREGVQRAHARLYDELLAGPGRSSCPSA